MLRSAGLARSRPLRGAAIHFGTLLGSMLSVVLWMIAAPRPAEAYVRTRNANGTAVAWARRGLSLVVAQADVRSTLALVPALRAAAASWGGDTLVCTDVSVSVDVRAVADPPAVRADQTSWVVLREEVRCGDPLRQTFCLQPETVALTTVFLRVAPGEPDDGEILDADLELNASRYHFTSLDSNATDADDRHDLQSILTHEMGHLLGFSHVCAASPFEREVDAEGVAVPSCEAATEGMRASAMFPTIPPGEVRARTLSDDDHAAVCAVYPRGEPTPRHTLTAPSGPRDAGAEEATPDAAQLADGPEPQAAGCAVVKVDQHPCAPPFWVAIAIAAGVARARRRHRAPLSAFVSKV